MPGPEAARVNVFVENQLDRFADKIEKILDVDVLAIVGPLYPGSDDDVRLAIEARKEKVKLRTRLGVILDTSGGIIEVVERIVRTIRYHYGEVTMIIPNRAMSAGAVFAMSGDSIMMDYFSCLGPIDPQIERNDRLVPALSYLEQFRRLKERSEKGTITTAEIVLLQQLDLAELHSFEQARDLSISLLKEWLANYKFKDWTITETRQKPVTEDMRRQRAVEVATKLMDQDTWHSHARPICMDVLRKDLNLKIEDFGARPELSEAVRNYYQFQADYMGKIGLFGVVHTSGAFLKWGGGG